MGTLNQEPTLVRVQSENLLSDVFRSTKLSGHRALTSALQRIAKEKHGVLLYIAQPKGGVYFDTTENLKTAASAHSTKMDFRDYGIGAQILAELGLKKIRILSGTTRNVIGLDGYDLEIVEQVKI